LRRNHEMPLPAGGCSDPVSRYQPDDVHGARDMG
jgi:hypothetical protein